MKRDLLETVEKKYLRPSAIEAIYSIKPGVLYKLINSGRVRSITLARGSEKKGTRLIERASLDEYLKALSDSQTASA